MEQHDAHVEDYYYVLQEEKEMQDYFDLQGELYNESFDYQSDDDWDYDHDKFIFESGF